MEGVWVKKGAVPGGAQRLMEEWGVGCYPEWEG